jgi:hypothetical protein
MCTPASIEQNRNLARPAKKRSGAVGGAGQVIGEDQNLGGLQKNLRGSQSVISGT